ncbi:DUF6778 family protein [Thalassobius sp. Cn5-15]|jgi:hypothetical protein|uniref:DUF6778 family protein n=1 Tax=Thalassobius sp. Cn5-15 TaxID=2917763 RepID=UPI001EF272DA|nr:DUF6778 family protein [Thalassobius sp. Cn5-15]MCG7492030.1 hypothetical protein [Thalassobius sp. Cn5-15]
MKNFGLAALIAFGFGLSACATVDTASRNAPIDLPQLAAPVTQSVTVADYNIKVSRELRVSEANVYYPLGDIVWRGEPIGDRHAQVARIFQSSVQRVQADTVDGALPVIVDIDVKRFHGMTEKTRYTVGGVHSITFDMTVRNPTTGAILVPPREISADLRGFGGSKAIQAEHQGRGQKVRITRHLANVIQQELTQPGSVQSQITELVNGLEVNIVPAGEDAVRL